MTRTEIEDFLQRHVLVHDYLCACGADGGDRVWDSPDWAAHVADEYMKEFAR